LLEQYYKQVSILIINLFILINFFNFFFNLLVVPFLVVLCFNSLIIYNFKQIKLNALGYGHAKSNSCVSVFSGGSYTSNYLNGQSRNNSLKIRSKKRTKKSGLKNDANSSFDFKAINKDRENMYFLNNSSRSPSPLLTRSNTPINGKQSTNDQQQQVTSLVSALNLAGNNKMRTSSPSPHQHISTGLNDSKSIASNSSSGACVENSTNVKLSPSKLFDSSYLMPPTQSSVRHQQQQQRLLEQQMNYNKSGSPSIGTTNSSANLSVAGSSNLTATTNLYQTNHISFCLNNNNTNNNTGTNLSINDKSENSPEYNMVETDLDTTQNSNKISNTANQTDINHQKSLLTVSNTPTKLSCKRRAFKVKINRETDIMLIVLSFSILLSQLPCTIAYYLIYHCNVLKYKGELTNVYLTARIPIILYIIRLLEMVYFSLNFFFYITLSPSLRKEIKSYTSKEALYAYFNKKFANNKLIGYLFGQTNMKNDGIQKQKVLNNCEKNKNKIIMKNIDSNSINNSILDADNIYSKSPSKYDQVSVPANNNCASFFIGSSENINNSNKQPQLSLKNNNNNRLNSNSSGEYYEFIQKLRSISPLRRPNLSQNDTVKMNTPKIKITDFELNDEKYEVKKKTKKNSKKNMQLFPKKNLDKKGSKQKHQDTKIQIIIDNVNDEENIVIDHCGSYYSDIGVNSLK